MEKPCLRRPAAEPCNRPCEPSSTSGKAPSAHLQTRPPCVAGPQGRSRAEKWVGNNPWLRKNLETSKLVAYTCFPLPQKIYVWTPRTRIVGHFPVTSDSQIGTWVTCLPDSGCLESNLTFGILRMSLTRGKKLHICCLNNTFPQPCALLCAPFYTNIGLSFLPLVRLSGRFPHLCCPITM